MSDVIKRGKGSETFHDASIDLSAGFIPKNTSAAGEPASAELTPDSFMAQHGNDVDPSAAEPEKFDFVPEAPVATDGREPKPIDGKTGLTWRWAAKADMPAVELQNFQAAAEKVAQNIAAAKSDTKAWTEKQRDHYYAEQRALEALRNGDRGPLDEALKTGAISRDDAHHLMQRSKRTWLQDKVHNFSYQEVMQVYNASGATEQQKSELQPIIRQKRNNLLLKHRGDEVRAVEAQ